jgi:hypothetical protein
MDPTSLDSLEDLRLLKSSGINRFLLQEDPDVEPQSASNAPDTAEDVRWQPPIPLLGGLEDVLFQKDEYNGCGL